MVECVSGILNPNVYPSAWIALITLAEKYVATISGHTSETVISPFGVLESKQVNVESKTPLHIRNTKNWINRVDVIHKCLLVKLA